jgi:hypothetical protein
VSVEFDIYWEGLAETERALARLEAMVRDLRWLWPRVSQLTISMISRQFDQEGAFFGSRWQALSPDYAAWKEIHFPGKKILSREGFLRRAATSPERQQTAMSLTLTIAPYEGSGGRTISPDWFQEGTSRMPARPILFEHPPEVVLAEYEQLLNREAETMLKRLGLLT